jgi:type VI secretion system secreted protein VgrG
MDPSKITLSSLTIVSDATTLQRVLGTMTEVDGTTATTITGGVVKIN